MNTTTTTRAYDALNYGDVIFFEYGCMHGSDIGTVVGFERTAWGDMVWVRNSDFSLDTVYVLDGELTGELCTDCFGEQYVKANRSAIREIGAYKLVLK